MIGAISRALLCGALGLLVGLGCSLKSPTQPCTQPEDCPLPMVCCTGGFYLSLNELAGPHCGTRVDCEGSFMPFQPAGAPCGRAMSGSGDGCKDGLTCCPSTLTCTTGDDCSAAPAPAPVEPPAGLTCSADSDCPASTVCCGINYQEREGTCSSYVACGAGQGIFVPSADAGVPGHDAGPQVVDGLAATICAEAYCGESGPRAPTAQEQAACTVVFEGGGFRATQECLDAIRATRSLCPYLLRPRGNAQTNDWPVLPNACRQAIPPRDPSEPTVRAACTQLVRCGHAGSLTVDQCAEQLAGLGYDNLSRIAELTDHCDWTTTHLGWAPATPASRCAVTNDCPPYYECVADEATHGFCTRGCSRDSDCGEGGQCLGRACYQTCDVFNSTDRAAAEAACDGRISTQGVGEMGCFSTVGVGGTVVGACAPVPAVDSCTVEPEPLSRTHRSLGYVCGATATGTIARHRACNPSAAEDPCADSACIAINGYYCSDPCVPSQFSQVCPMGEVCVGAESGLGVTGGCMRACVSGACPGGGACMMTPFGEVCRPG